MASQPKSGNRSVKHEIIHSANARMFAAIAIAVFIVIFCLFASQALFSQSLYQQRIISEKQATLRTLQDNKRSVEELESAYADFVNDPVNVIGGDSDGDGADDGDNAKIVLDALPSELDYPGLSSSIEKILLEGEYGIESIGGDGIVENIDGDEALGRQPPVEVPYPVRVTTAPDKVLNLLQTLESSIRPFHVNSLQLESAGGDLQVSIDMETYYQPASGLEVDSKVVQ